MEIVRLVARLNYGVSQVYTAFATLSPDIRLYDRHSQFRAFFGNGAQLVFGVRGKRVQCNNYRQPV